MAYDLLLSFAQPWKPHDTLPLDTPDLTTTPQDTPGHPTALLGNPRHPKILLDTIDLTTSHQISQRHSATPRDTQDLTCIGAVPIVILIFIA